MRDLATHTWPCDLAAASRRQYRIPVVRDGAVTTRAVRLAHAASSRTPGIEAEGPTPEENATR